MQSKEIVKANLTNEKVKAKFTNQFDLVNCAIGYAREIIHGRNPTVETENQNIAVKALMELNSQEIS